MRKVAPFQVPLILGGGETRATVGVSMPCRVMRPLASSGGGQRISFTVHELEAGPALMLGVHDGDVGLVAVLTVDLLHGALKLFGDQAARVAAGVTPPPDQAKN